MQNPVKEAIEALYRPIEGIVRTLAGPAAEEIGLSFRDSVQVWRFKRQVRLFKRVQEICAEAGIKPGGVRLPLLFDIVDKATLEEDDDLQDRWANLLANAADSNYQGLISAAFPDILRQISKDEAIFLEDFYKKWEASKEEAKRTQRYVVERIEPLDISSVYMDNLQRLRLIEWFDDPKDPYREDGNFYTTSFGDAFICACTTPKKIETVKK